MARATRSLAEMQFAVSLVPCPGCGRRDGRGLPIYGDGTDWSLAGKCPVCATVRNFQFDTTGTPYASVPKGFELGTGPSTWITEAQFRAELARVAPLIKNDPAKLSAADWRAGWAALEVALTCVAELVKLPVGDLAKLSTERDRLEALRKKYHAESARISSAEETAQYELVGDSGAETKLLRHRASGFSLPLPGHATLGEPVESPIKLDVVARLADLPIEIGFRLDTLPAGNKPGALADALATAVVANRATGSAKVRPAGEAMSHAIYEHAPGQMEHVLVAVREREGGLWAMYVVTRYAIGKVNPIQWANLRDAVLPELHWDPAAPRTTAPALWPATTRIAEPGVALRMYEEALREAKQKAEDLGSLTRDDVRTLTDAMLEIGTQEQAPTVELPRMYVEMACKQIAMRTSTAVAEVLTRNTELVANVHDMRGWAWQCIYAIGNRAELLS